MKFTDIVKGVFDKEQNVKNGMEYYGIKNYEIVEEKDGFVINVDGDVIKKAQDLRKQSFPKDSTVVNNKFI